MERDDITQKVEWALLISLFYILVFAAGMVHGVMESVL